MLMTGSAVRFSRDEAAAQLDLPPRVVDALIESGRLALTSDAIAAEQIEAFCRDTLLRVYRASATYAPPTFEVQEIASEPLPVRQPEPEPPPTVTRSIAEYVDSPEQADADLRIAPRYSPRRQLGGMFRQAKFNILQISTSGMRVRHDETLRPGDEARLTFSILRPARTFMIKARVVWTSIAQRGDGPSFCISGIRVVEGFEQLRQAIDILRDARELEIDDGSAQRNRHTSPAALVGLSDDDVASIIRAYRTFGSDPVEANRWYTRAKFALSEEAVRKAAPTRARDREEVLGVWEYLERRVEIPAIASVLGWIRRTRSATAVA
jgi:hypothetical protein